MGKPDQFKASDFITAIPGSGGIITTIAQRVGCTWHTAKRYISNYPTIAQAYADEFEGILDMTEVKLIEAIKGGDMGAIKYMLSTRGKGRGYVERHELTGEGGGPVQLKYTGNVKPDQF